MTAEELLADLTRLADEWGWDADVWLSSPEAVHQVGRVSYDLNNHALVLYPKFAREED